MDKVSEGWDDLTEPADVDYAAAANAEARLKPCTAEQVLKDKVCDNLKIVVIDAARMPFIARNITLAWAEGREFVLTRDAEDSRRAARYRQSCRSGVYQKQYPEGSCDEYAFASTWQGWRRRTRGGSAGPRTELPGRHLEHGVPLPADQRR